MTMCVRERENEEGNAGGEEGFIGYEWRESKQ